MDNYDFNALTNEVVCRGINMFESFDDWTKGAFALSNLGNDGLPILRLSAVSAGSTTPPSARERSGMHSIPLTVLGLPPLYICANSMALTPTSFM